MPHRTGLVGARLVQFEESIERRRNFVRRDTTSRIRAEDVEDLVRFLYANSLTEQSASGRVKDYVEQEAAA